MRSGRRTFGTIKPGRRDDALALAEEGRKVFERLGAETRITIGGAGAPARSIYFLAEAPSATELGKVLDGFMSDSDALSLQTRLTAADSPVEIQELTSYTVIDLGLPAGKRGKVGSTVMWRPAPGRLADALALATDAGEALLRLGACRARVAAIISGEMAGSYVSVSEHESFSAQGATRDALETDQAWVQQLQPKLAGKDAPGTFVGFADWMDPNA